MVTEFADRGDLKGAYKYSQRSGFTRERGINIFRDILSAITFLHSRSPEPIVHRDLKSGNIFITNEWVGKLGDFGESRISDPTSTMTQVGTCAWMAPELLCAERYTAKGELFSYQLP